MESPLTVAATQSPASVPARPPDPCLLVLFGATGDLAHRKIAPALFALHRGGELPSPFGVLATSTSVKDAPTYRADLRQSLAASFQAFAASEGPVTVELIDFMKTAVPTGTVEFLKGGISRSDLQGTRLWRGSIVSPSGNRYPIWVRVRLQQNYKIVVAQETIGPGSSISEAQVAVETRRLPYQESAAFFADPALVAGRTAIRQIQDGQTVLRKDIVAAREIQAGDTVAVTAVAGAAHLTLEAKAETAGLRGGSILLKNPLSGKKFRATVTGPGHASVQGLVHAN